MSNPSNRASMRGQLTLRGVVIGVLGCVIITASSAYTALKMGALPWPIVFAAVISLFFLKLMGNASLNEANVTHTIMSAGAMVAGGLAGAITGVLTTVFEIPAILAGILTQISLWSINLRIMGKSNTPILAKGTVFSAVSNMTGLPQSTVAIILGILLAVAIVAILYWFFGTEIGSALRATGNNEYMIRALGVNTNSTKMIALVLSDALIGLSGALICQSQKYADIGMGTGAIVIGLAAIVIGEVLGRLLPGGLTQFSVRLASAVFGSVVYFLIRAIVLQLGMDANDMKLLSAVIVAVALCVPVVWERYKLRSSYTKGDEADA